jgi:hypothetical protein
MSVITRIAMERAGSRSNTICSCNVAHLANVSLRDTVAEILTP